MKLELRHLQIVCAIADQGSLSKAASALGIAQPALTAQLQRIERALGGALFERDRRGARPTPLGELVLSRARVVLPAVQGLQAEAARLVRGESPRRYRIGSVNGPILSGLVHRIATSEPGAELAIDASWSATELSDQLAAGRLDFILIGTCGDAAPPTDHELAWQVIAVDAVFVLLPESHPLAGGGEVDLADLADAQWAAVPGRSCLRDCFTACCVRAGFTPRAVYEGDPRTCMELVEVGEAVALCQSSFRPPPGLVAMPIAGAPLRWRHLLGWHPQSSMAAMSGQMVRFAVESYQDAAQRSPRFVKWLEGRPGFGAVTL